MATLLGTTHVEPADIGKFGGKSLQAETRASEPQRTGEKPVSGSRVDWGRGVGVGTGQFVLGP